jgi:hypothetical protein
VGKRVGRLLFPSELNQAREVCLEQKAEDATDRACVTTYRLYNHPTPAQILRKIVILYYDFQHII